MGKGKRRVLVAGKQNPVTRLETWLAKKPLPIQDAVLTVTSAVHGASIGGVVGKLTHDFFSTFIASPASLKAQVPPPLVLARNFAVIFGVDHGIFCVMTRLRGKEDVQTHMAAGLGGGVMSSLVNNIWSPSSPQSVILNGVSLALIQGGAFMLDEKKSQLKAEQLLYKETRGMLASLGLERYEKNFKKGFLTDNTLPLLTESALFEIGIPVGARLLILDHIERKKEVKKSG